MTSPICSPAVRAYCFALLAALGCAVSGATLASSATKASPAKEQGAGLPPLVDGTSWSDDPTIQPIHALGNAFKTCKADRIEDAAFWFYLGRLRWQARLLANPPLDPSGEPALFSILIGFGYEVIDGYAARNPNAATAIIDRVLAWDDAHPDPSIPADIRNYSRDSLADLRSEIRSSADRMQDAVPDDWHPNC